MFDIHSEIWLTTIHVAKFGRVSFTHIHVNMLVVMTCKICRGWLRTVSVTLALCEPKLTRFWKNVEDSS